MNSRFEKSNVASDRCKIFGNTTLDLRAHTARCQKCGVLLHCPYPTDEELERTGSPDEIRAACIAWSEPSAFHSHRNSTDHIRFAIPFPRASERLRILDCGGGGGQFALGARLHLPHTEVWMVNASGDTRVEAWRSPNHQISFAHLATDETRFNYMFVNDVFEHVSDPIEAL